MGLQPVAQGLVAPVQLVAPPDGSGRLFVVDQTGVIRIITAQGQLLPQPFLDVRSRMVGLNTGYDERGLLGLAFHPQYAQNGRFFVYYNIPLRGGAPAGYNHTDRVAEYKVSAQDANSADPASERVILEVDHPDATHNGGGLAFGLDGYLYITLGDGGGPGEVRSNAQDTSSLLGKILRIDVDHGDPYGIPPDNPFAGGPGRPEVYAYGLRNPYRLAFDSGGDHSMYVEDAGESLWEEVDIVVKGGNYGWPIREGAHCFNRDNPTQSLASCATTGAGGSQLIDPIVEYPNIQAPGGIGMVGIGGMIYRGKAMPAMQGRYLFGDWGTNYTTPNGTLLVASPPVAAGQMWTLQKLTVATSANGRANAFVRGFGEDANHEMYVLTSLAAGPRGATGRVYKIVAP